MAITAAESGNNDQASLEQVLRQIEILRQENETVRQEAERERAQWLADHEQRRLEMQVEQEKLQRESEEARQRLEESIRQQELLRKSNDELRTWMRNVATSKTPTSLGEERPTKTTITRWPERL